MTVDANKIKQAIDNLDEGKVVDILAPSVVQSLTSLFDGKIENMFAEKIDKLKEVVQTGLWDNLVDEIGKVTGLPPQIVAELKTFDDRLKVEGDKLTGFMQATLQKVNEFAGRLDGIDLNETVTMTYRALMKERAKSQAAGLLVGFVSGAAFMVMLLYWLGFL